MNSPDRRVLPVEASLHRLITNLVASLLLAVAACHPPSRYADPSRIGQLEARADRISPPLTLETGMRMIVETTRGQRLVAAQVWVELGSADEPSDLAGAAHLLQRSSLRSCTSGRHVGVVQEIERAGGNVDAWTSHDHTVYQVVMPKRLLAQGLQLLAACLAAGPISPRELDQLVPRIVDWIGQAAANPDRAVSQALFQAAYREHPYRRAVVGRPTSLEKLSVVDLRGLHRRGYLPRRMLLAIAGDVELHEATAAAQRAFATHRAASSADQPLSRTRRVEPAQHGTRVVAEQRRTRAARLSLAFHIPPFNHLDTPVLDIAAALLGQGRNARLVRALQHRLRLVIGVTSYIYAPRNPGLLVINATVRPERVVEALSAILAHVLTIGRDELGRTELRRAQAIVERRNLATHRRASGLARTTALNLLLTGDANFTAKYLQRVDRVDARALRDTARRYLRTDNLTVAVVTPYVDPHLVRDLRQAARHAHRLPPLAQQHHVDVVQRMRVDGDGEAAKIVQQRKD